VTIDKNHIEKSYEKPPLNLNISENGTNEASTGLDQVPPESMENSAKNNDKLIDMSLSLRFSRPYDLPMNTRDQYIDSIYFRYKFENKPTQETARFLNPDSNPNERNLLLSAKFDKKSIETMRNGLGLDFLTPETIIDEVFNVNSLTKISRTFFKIRLQVFYNKFHQLFGLYIDFIGKNHDFDGKKAQIGASN